MKKTISDYASRSLGDSSSYAVYTKLYDPKLLNPMPRILARQDYGITGKEFNGFDVWHCYEATFLLDNGMPVAGVVQIVIPSSTEFMLESKSMKLFFNSFDMCMMGPTKLSAIQNYVDTLKNCLNTAIGIEVGSQDQIRVKFFEEGVQRNNYYLQQFTNLTEVVDIDDIKVTDYNAEQNHLDIVEIPNVSVSTITLKFYTNVLRSRCRHTKQKDTGSAYIELEVTTHSVTTVSLLKHIISLREKDEFHEFCAEKLFMDLQSIPGLVNLTVMLLYVRRGSLDINPLRSTKAIELLIDHPLLSFTEKTFFQ